MPEDKIPKIAIIVIVSILAISAVAGGYFVWKGKAGDNVVACTEEAKICPDGSAVGRTGPNCEFAPCPGDIDTSDWKTYRNEKYGFEFKYPGNWETFNYRFMLNDFELGFRDEDYVQVLEILINNFEGDFNQYIDDSWAASEVRPPTRKIREINIQGNIGLLGEGQDEGGTYQIFKVQQKDYLYSLVGEYNNIQPYLFDQILSTFKFIDANSFKTTGIVSGRVSIGPLCPVECPEMGPDIYSPLQLVFTPTGEGRPVDLPFYAKLSSDGSYSIELPESNYSVTLKDCAYLGCSTALPKSIFVKANESVQSDIDIDTGIR